MLSTRRTPPMGWNSWNAFHTRIDQKCMVENAAAMVDKGLLDAGYEYFVVDDGWQAPARVDGRLQSDPDRFPDGMGWLGEQVRDLGLRFGMYLTPGRRTCAEIFDNYGDGSGLGSFGHEAQDLAQLIDWGVEFLKYDWCRGDSCGTGLNERLAFTRMSELIVQSPGELVYSISEYGVSQPWDWAPGVAHMWRTTKDITPHWWHVLWCARRTERRVAATAPGGVNDPDMLVAGIGNVTGAAAWSHVAIWAMLAAPLMAGNDLRTMDAETTRALCDPVLVGLSQDPLVSAGRLILRRPGLDVWERRTTTGSARLVVNTWPFPRSVSLSRWATASTALHTAEGAGAYSPRIGLPARGSVLLLSEEASP